MIKKLTILLGVVTFLSAQQFSGDHHTFKGVITDELDEPLIGAAVIVKGTNIGTLTDTNGMFSLTYHREKATLVISYTGYETRTLTARAGKEITERLQASVVPME